MSTFPQSKGLFVQTHFTIIEIDLPVVTGACTVNGVAGYGTPSTCDQSSNETRTYKFTETDAPHDIPETDVFRVVSSISETPAKLNTGKGLASRGVGTIKLADFLGKDPNSGAPAVTSQVKAQGGYLAKMFARNEMANKDIRIKNYRVESDGTIDLLNGAETRHYIIESMNKSSKGDWSIKFKDELSRVNIDESVWPLPLEGSLINAITDVQTTFDVDANVTYLIGDTIRCGDELMKITGVSGIGTGSASVTVQTRGNDIVYTNTLSKTEKTEHDAGDELFVCDVSDDEKINDLLERILLDVDIGASFIPSAEWATEMDLWHTNTRINFLWIESENTNDVLRKILERYMVNMWFDPVAREIPLSAISVWQQSTSVVEEGNQIDFETLTTTRNEQLRCTRAFVTYDKRFLTATESIESYKKGSLFVRSELEQANIFGKPKTKRLGLSGLLDKDSADLLVNRWVNRYVNPIDFNWITQERKLNFTTGDIVDVSDLTTVGIDGLPKTGQRCQITSITPRYKKDGRDYKITALSYEPTFDAGSEIIITGETLDISLYIQYAGAPATAVDLTFIFDGTICGSSSNSIPAIKAGAFPAGSTLTFILANGADLGAKGGAGGNGEVAFFQLATGIVSTITPPQDGLDGGTCYDAEGIETNIYFSGATGSTNFPTADGYIKAPTGGAGGFDAEKSPANSGYGLGGDGGNGGDGRIAGAGGAGGDLIGHPSANTFGDNGTTGNDQGTTTGFGLDGANNNAQGGDAGKGVIDNGATVTFFGDTPARYINGGGDH